MGILRRDERIQGAQKGREFGPIERKARVFFVENFERLIGRPNRQEIGGQVSPLLVGQVQIVLLIKPVHHLG